jgi:hypothetical protein
MRLQILIVAVVSLGMFVAVPTARAVGRDAFNGTWKVTVAPADDDASKAGAKEFKDTLTFKANQFESATLKAKGFKAQEYDEDTRSGIAATFKCEVKSEKEGSVKWTGTSTAGQIKGELEWTKADGTVLKYTYTGERQS